MSVSTMFADRAKGKFARVAIVLTGVLGLSAAVAQFQPAEASAHAGPRYQRGLYVSNGWLCRGWDNGAFHCTQRWHRDRAGHLISDNQAWVSTSGASASHAVNYSAPRNGGGDGGHVGYSPAPGNIGQWVAPAGYHAYSIRGGQSCTWWPQHVRGLPSLGNAAQWTYNAARRGFGTGYSPRAGSTVVFQPGVQGAGGLGHVAQVERVYGNGWFLVSEMNFSWNGGGYGRVSYRYAHTGGGVSFIY